MRGPGRGSRYTVAMDARAPGEAGLAPVGPQLPRDVERLALALAGLVLLGVFIFYAVVWVRPQTQSGHLEQLLRDVTDGHAAAPYQYRIFVPALLVFLVDHTRLDIGQATVLVDGLSLAIAAWFGWALLRQRGLQWAALPAAMYAGFLAIGVPLGAKPETFFALAATTVIARVVAGAPFDVWAALAVVGLAFSRTDLLGALALGIAMHWWLDRSRRGDLLLASGMIVVALVALGLVVAHYPDAHYPEGVGPIQLTFNGEPVWIVVAFAYLGPAFAPLLLLEWPRGVQRPALQAAVRGAAPLLATAVAEVSFTFVFGRINEVRLFFPLAAILAVLAAELWTAAARGAEGSPVR
jgi:hypothetical protein